MNLSILNFPCHLRYLCSTNGDSRDAHNVWNLFWLESWGIKQTTVASTQPLDQKDTYMESLPSNKSQWKDVHNLLCVRIVNALASYWTLNLIPSATAWSCTSCGALALLCNEVTLLWTAVMALSLSQTRRHERPSILCDLCKNHRVVISLPPHVNDGTSMKKHGCFWLSPLSNQAVSTISSSYAPATYSVCWGWR